jgi:hypothetical protein
MAEAALALQQESQSQQRRHLGDKIRATYGDEFAESFTKIKRNQPEDTMEQSVVQWCKLAMEANYFIKCRYGEELRKKPFPREGFDMVQLQEWACHTFGLSPEALQLEYRGPTGAWFALSTNDHFHNAVRAIRPSESEPFSLTIRASERSEAAPPVELPEQPVSSSELEVPDYDADRCTQFLLLGLDEPGPAVGSGEWENGVQCRACLEKLGEEATPYFGYVFNRRHHCRKCLKSFCWECSDNFHQIEPEGPEVRLCNRCASSPL